MTWRQFCVWGSRLRVRININSNVKDLYKIRTLGFRIAIRRLPCLMFLPFRSSITRYLLLLQSEHRNLNQHSFRWGPFSSGSCESSGFNTSLILLTVLACSAWQPREFSHWSLSPMFKSRCAIQVMGNYVHADLRVFFGEHLNVSPFFWYLQKDSLELW